MIKAVFLDRDGVINNDTGHYYIFKPSDFEINNGIIEALKLIKSRGYEFVVITNQGGIARGTYAKSDVELVHAKFLAELEMHDLKPLNIYYCPHHNKFEQCLCRKPEPLMLEKAMARFNIDKEKSFMIGDNEKDVKAANNAGVRGYLIESNQNILPLVSKLLNEN